MKNNIDSNFAIAIIALVSACVGFTFWLYSFNHQELAYSSNVSLQKSNSAQVNNSKEENAEKYAINQPLREDLPREYISEKHGIKFLYQSWGAYDLNVLEDDNHIWFDGEDAFYKDIEVFTFDKNLSHVEGIKELFLNGKDYDDECFVEILEYEDYYGDNYEQALISHPIALKRGSNADPNSEPWIFVSDNYCPEYTFTNGRQFFYYNKEVSGKVIFVRTGQDTIASEGNGNDWSHSIEIFETGERISTQSMSSEWSEYKNTEHGFSISYPSKIYGEPIINEKGGFDFPALQDNKNRLVVQQYSDGVTLTEYVEIAKGEGTYSFIKEVLREQNMVIQEIEEPGFGTWHHLHAFNDDGHIFVGGRCNTSKVCDDIKKILSTFKLL